MLAGHFGQWGTGIHSKLFCGMTALTVRYTVRVIYACLSNLQDEASLAYSRKAFNK
jgi:hypothetical protein